MSGNASNIKAGGAFVEIGGDDTKLKAALDRAAKRFKIFATMANQIGREMLKIGTAIVAPIALAAKTYETMGNELFRASQRAGIGAGQLSALGYAAQQSGVTMEDLENGIKKMQKTLGDAAGGSKEANQALEQIGVTMEDLKGLAPDEQFVTLAEALSKVQDPTMQAAEAMKIFGKNGTALLPMINQGVDGINAYIRRASALGIVIGDEAARGAAEFHDRLEDLTDVLKNSFFRAGEAVTPMLQDLVENVTRGVIVVNRWITAHKDLVVTALKVGAGVAAAGVAFLALGKGITLVAGAFKGLGAAAGLARSVFSVFPPLLTAMLNPVVLVGAGLVGLGAYFLYATDAGRKTLKALGGYFSDLGATASEVFGGITDALGAGDWKLAADVAWAGVKLAFAQGIAPLKTLWVGVTTFMQTTWAKLGATLAETWFRAIAKVKDALAGFVNLYKSSMVAAGGFIAKEEEERRHNAEHGRLLGLYSTHEMSKEEYDRQEAKENAFHANQLGAVDNSTSEQMNKFDAEMRKAADANEADLQQRLTNIEQTKAADLKRIDEQSRASVDANQKDLDDKKAKLDALRKQAHQEGGGKGLFGALPGLPAPPELKLPGLPSAGDLSGIMGQVKAAGTFNARGAFGLANGNLAQRQLTAMEKVAKLAEEGNRTAKDLARTLTAGLTLA